jgi:hypothetical protein
MQRENRKSKIENGNWLPDMDLNHDKQIQSLLCYRYTIGQAGASDRLDAFTPQSRLVRVTAVTPLERCRAKSGVRAEAGSTVQRFNDSTEQLN